jgi:hypothetical protein
VIARNVIGKLEQMMSVWRTTRVQRLILYGAATVWFMAFTLARQRNYQDSWILADIFWPFVACVLLYIWVVAAEPDNRVITVVSAWTVYLVNIIPGLKYTQPYGNSLDGAIHYIVTNSLMTTGRSIAPDEVYASIAGMHGWLASLGLTGGVSAVNVIKFGLPLVGISMPLMIYWLSRCANVPAGSTRYAIALAPLASYTLYEPFGAGFTVTPLVLFLGVLLLRQHYDRQGANRLLYTILLLIGVAQLTIWHSTTPMLLPVILAALSLTPALVKLVNRQQGHWRPWGAFIWMAVLVGIAFLAYHVLPTDQMFRVVATSATKFGLGGGAQEVVPTRAFQISLTDLIQVALVIQGRDIAMIFLMLAGALIVWRNRKVWTSLLYFYAYWLLLAAVFGGLIITSLTGLDYGRFLVTPVAISPFLGGVALWWLHERITARARLVRWGSRVAWPATLATLTAVWMVAFFNFQPLVPKARSLAPGVTDEYVLWVHAVNTDYQSLMLDFAEHRTKPVSRFALDITGHRQFLRYYGLDEGYSRRLYLPLHYQEPVQRDRVNFYLLHWPGVAGGMAEQVEWRSTAKIEQIRQTPDWGLVYDNGQSFILSIR